MADHTVTEVGLFPQLVQRQEDVRLFRERWRSVAGDLGLLDELTISQAESAMLDAARRALGDAYAVFITRLVLSPNTLARLRSLVPREIERLRQLVIDWHAFLDQALREAARAEHPERHVCAAFSLIEDSTLYLKQDVLDALVRATADREGVTKERTLQLARSRADAMRNCKGGNLQEEIWDGIDILALIIVLMNREGLKPVVRDMSLQDWLVEYFGRDTYAAQTIGGSTASQSYILSAAGQQVLVYAPYHHSHQAECAPATAYRLVFERNGLVHPYPPLQQGVSEDPRRHSLILQLTPLPDAHGRMGPVMRIGNDDIRPKAPDRIILRIPHPRASGERRWQTLRLIWRGAGNERVEHDPEQSDPSTIAWREDAGWVAEINRHDPRAQRIFRDFSERDWPWFPVFQHQPHVDEDDVLTVELASDDEVHAVADDVCLALLGGIQALGKTVLTESITELLRQALISQLQALASQGATLHFELSGVTSGATLEKLQKLFKESGICHVSINREELVQITSEPGSPYFVWPKPYAPENAMGIFLRAQELLTKLEIETCYVHDVEMDILVLRNTDGADASVSLQRHRQAMLLAKAAVPEALLRRSGQRMDWPLILSSPSFAALLGFARDYAEYLAGRANVAGNDSKIDKPSVENAILHKGFYQPPASSREVAVVVAPGIYVDLGPNVSMTGAGDMCFAVHAAYSHPEFWSRSS